MKLQQKFTTATAKSIDPAPIYKQCEAENCPDQFIVEWPSMRRCKKCRAAKKPYRKKGLPF